MYFGKLDMARFLKDMLGISVMFGSLTKVLNCHQGDCCHHIIINLVDLWLSWM